MTNIYFVDFSLVLQVIDSEHLKTRLIFESLASNGQAEILGQFQYLFTFSD